MATLPFLQDISQRTGWYTYGDLMNMLAVSESTPGPIGINMATYVGFTVAGIPGAGIAGFSYQQVSPHRLANWNTTPTTAERPIKTMGWRFFVGFSMKRKINAERRKNPPLRHFHSF